MTEASEKKKWKRKIKNFLVLLRWKSLGIHEDSKYWIVTEEANKKDRYEGSELKNDEGFGFMSFSGNLPILPTLEMNMMEAKASFACLKMREWNEKNVEKNFNGNEVRDSRGYNGTASNMSERNCSAFDFEFRKWRPLAVH